MLSNKVISSKIIIIISVMIFIFSTIVSATPSDWAEEFLKAMLLEELSNEELLVSDKLQDAITREEFAELTVRLYAKAKNISVDDIVQWNPFSDTDNIMVAKAYNIGIVSGTGQDSLGRMLFSPTKNVTRQEIAVMLVKELNLLNIDVDIKNNLNYSDSDMISSWAYDAVSFVTENNILSGMGDNKISPISNATREQSLVIINKMANKYGWCDNDIIEPIFNYYNSTSVDGFIIPNYNASQLRVINNDYYIKYIISNLVDSYKIDIKKQQNELVNILINADKISYDVFIIIKEKIFDSYDFVSKKFNKQNTIYIDIYTGNSYSYEISKPYIKITVDTEFSVEYMK